MSQKRIQDFGSPVVAKSFKLLAEALTTPSILEGNEFIVDASDRVRINPGTCVTNEGIIIIEDEIKTLTVANTSIPMDYTIYYDHQDADITGGVSAILTLASGLLTSDVISGCILGYIRYPGGGVPLDTSHFIQPPMTQIGDILPTKENAPWLVPIKSQGYMVTSTSGSVLNITDTWDISGTYPVMYVKIRNNTLSSGSATLTFPFKVANNPYSLLQMMIGTDINALITPHFIDSVGNISTLSSAFTGQPTISLKSVIIPATTEQNSNTLVYLQLEITLAASREAKIQALGLNTYNLPI